MNTKSVAHRSAQIVVCMMASSLIARCQTSGVTREFPVVNDRVLLKGTRAESVNDATLFNFACREFQDANRLVQIALLAATAADLRTGILARKLDELRLAEVKLRNQIDLMPAFTEDQVMKKLEMTSRCSSLQWSIIKLREFIDLRDSRLKSASARLTEMTTLELESLMRDGNEYHGESPNEQLLMIERHFERLLIASRQLQLRSLPAQTVLKYLDFRMPVVESKTPQPLSDEDVRKFAVARLKVLTGPQRGSEVYVWVGSLAPDCPGLDQLGYVARQCNAAYKRDELIAYTEAAESGDTASVNSLKRKRRVFSLDRGSKVRVVTDGALMRVKVVGGKQDGKVLWVERSALSTALF